jgi:hypothetical protein
MMRLNAFSVAIFFILYTVAASLGGWEQSNRQFLHSLSDHIRLRLDDPAGLATKEAGNENSLKALESLMNVFKSKSAQAFKDFQSKSLHDDRQKGLETLHQRLGYEWIRMGKEMHFQKFHQSGGSPLEDDASSKRLVWLIGISVFSLIHQTLRTLQGADR